MRSVSLFVAVGMLAACNGKKAFPDSVDLLEHKVRTPNAAVLIQGSLYDTDQDGEADFAGGSIELLGTSFDSPCDMLTSGEPPAGEAGSWVRFSVLVNDLPMDTLWEVGQEFELTALGGREMRFQAAELDDSGAYLMEAGGPPGGRVALTDHTEFGLGLLVEASVGFVDVGGELTSVQPPEPLLLDLLDVPICPGSSGI